MTCNLLSKSGKKTYINIRSVMLPATSGKVDILPGHAEFLTLLEMGEITVKTSDGLKVTAQIKSGFCRVDHQSDTVTLLF